MTAERVDTTAGEVLPASTREQLAKLAQPFPDGFVESKDGKSYVAHHIINQRLLSVVGPFDFELVEVIRGDVAAVAPDPQGRSRRARAGTPALHNVVVGGVWRLSCEVDGRRARVEEIGDVGDVHNWDHDGARLKDAASDALKRCAMRLGLGLHLWAQDHYFLERQLRQDGGRPVAEAPADAPRASNRASSEASPSQAPEAGETSPSPASGANGQPDLARITSVSKARAYIKGQPEAFQQVFSELSVQARESGALDGLSDLDGYLRLIARAHARIAGIELGNILYDAAGEAP